MHDTILFTTQKKVYFMIYTVVHLDVYFYELERTKKKTHNLQEITDNDFFSNSIIFTFPKILTVENLVLFFR